MQSAFAQATIKHPPDLLKLWDNTATSALWKTSKILKHSLRQRVFKRFAGTRHGVHNQESMCYKTLFKTDATSFSRVTCHDGRACLVITCIHFSIAALTETCHFRKRKTLRRRLADRWNCSPECRNGVLPPRFSTALPITVTNHLSNKMHGGTVMN